MISPTIITLQPDDTSALVFATVIDDPYPEDDFTYYVAMNSDHGSQTINLTIHDNDCEWVVIELHNVLLYKFAH